MSEEANVGRAENEDKYLHFTYRSPDFSERSSSVEGNMGSHESTTFASEMSSRKNDRQANGNEQQEEKQDLCNPDKQFEDRCRWFSQQLNKLQGLRNVLVEGIDRQCQETIEALEQLRQSCTATTGAGLSSAASDRHRDQFGHLAEVDEFLRLEMMLNRELGNYEVMQRNSKKDTSSSQLNLGFQPVNHRKRRIRHRPLGSFRPTISFSKLDPQSPCFPQRLRSPSVKSLSPMEMQCYLVQARMLLENALGALKTCEEMENSGERSMARSGAEYGTSSDSQPGRAQKLPKLGYRNRTEEHLLGTSMSQFCQRNSRFIPPEYFEKYRSSSINSDPYSAMWNANSMGLLADPFIMRAPWEDWGFASEPVLPFQNAEYKFPETMRELYSRLNFPEINLPDQRHTKMKTDNRQQPKTHSLGNQTDSKITGIQARIPEKNTAISSASRLIENQKNTTAAGENDSKFLPVWENHEMFLQKLNMTQKPSQANSSEIAKKCEEIVKIVENCCSNNEDVLSDPESIVLNTSQMTFQNMDEIAPITTRSEEDYQQSEPAIVDKKPTTKETTSGSPSPKDLTVKNTLDNINEPWIMEESETIFAEGLNLQIKPIERLMVEQCNSCDNVNLLYDEGGMETWMKGIQKHYSLFSNHEVKKGTAPTPLSYISPTYEYHYMNPKHKQPRTNYTYAGYDMSTDFLRTNSFRFPGGNPSSFCLGGGDNISTVGNVNVYSPQERTVFRSGQDAPSYGQFNSNVPLTAVKCRMKRRRRRDRWLDSFAYPPTFRNLPRWSHLTLKNMLPTLSPPKQHKTPSPVYYNYGTFPRNSSENINLASVIPPGIKIHLSRDSKVADRKEEEEEEIIREEEEQEEEEEVAEEENEDEDEHDSERFQGGNDSRQVSH
ncbi:unnamed protein product [Cyprideis torosa]|uniref:Uncharacterized protein n=1 Tax=Cyprideis torosa TaxID=163714 RepID=A0A7R8W247_9CRUS|nr:unnamed protein product [Cyprideis torosa]CAG0881591.1 unnamed protein product [Cyprideis torosa]